MKIHQVTKLSDPLVRLKVVRATLGAMWLELQLFLEAKNRNQVDEWPGRHCRLPEEEFKLPSRSTLPPLLLLFPD